MRKMKKLAISIMSCVFAMSVGLLAWMGFDASKINSAKASISVEYKEIYSIGETVVVQPADFDYQGKKYPANVVVRFPNGNSYRYSQFLLSDAGEYTIEYSAVADDNTLLKETRSFTVLANAYSFSGEGSYEYGKNRYLGEDVEGLNVKLGRNSTFTINTPINVSNLTNEDSIIKFYATPDIKGSAEAGWLYVRLTDVHNPDVYVEWMYQPVGTFQYVYGNANGQATTGLRQTSTPSADTETVKYLDYDGYYYMLYRNDTTKKGHVTRASLTGTMDANNQAKILERYFPNNASYTEEELFYHNALEVRMDYAEKRLYSQPDGVYAISRSIVADFDDERALGDKEPWAGFTTGEAVLSIYAKDYTASNFNFFITDIYGQKVDEMTTQNKVAPRLEVDTNGYEENNLPNAIVGKTYPLFDVLAIDDVDGEVNVSVKVYNSIGATFSVVDNCFIPTVPGTYTIEYSAKDGFGNQSVKKFKVYAFDRPSLQYELSSGKTEFLAGEVVKVKGISLHNPANLYDLQIVAKCAEQNVEYTIDTDTLTFLPLYAGTYEIVYTYTDYCTEEIISDTITVKQSDIVAFEDNILLPKYIIKGLNYPVLPMYGYTFTNGTQKLLAQLYVKEGEGQERLINDDTYSVQGNVDTVQLIYKINGVEKSYLIPVVDAVQSGNKVDLSKYFYPTVGGFSSTGDNKKIEFTANNAVNGVAKLEVINPARLISEFDVMFELESGKTNFTGINVVFTSAYDENKTILFQFERESETSIAAKVRVVANNFTAEGSISSKFRTPAVQDEKFNITYDPVVQSFMIGGFSVDANKVWEGFDDQFYISFELYGIEGPASIGVTRVVNQKITSNPTDGVTPKILFGSFNGYYVVGDEVVVNNVNVYDFIDPNPTCTLTLQKGNTFLTSTDGVKLNGEENRLDRAYIVKVETAETMTFKIIASDFGGKKSTSITMNLIVKDVIAPMIQLQVVKNLYKVGETVTIAACDASDETSTVEALEVTYYLISPDGSVKYLSDTSFTVEQAGEYRIQYIVRDESGNSGFAYYTICVE